MTVTRSSDQLSTSVALRAELCAAELLPSSARKSCAKSFAKRIGHWTVAVFFALSIATPVAAYVRIEENQNSRTIHIFGTFLPQDFNRLDAMLEQMEKRRPLTDITVTLDSTGGAHVEGVRLGLLLHRKGIGTQIMPGGTCFSACAAIFFGGFDQKTGKPNRVAHEGSRLGVHRALMMPSWRRQAHPDQDVIDHPVSTAAKSHQDAKDRRAFAATKLYFADMRISEKIWRMFEETPPKDMYIVTPSDMAESDITFVPASTSDALSVAPGGPQFAVAGNGSPPNNEPRKIKTLPVRGDQSVPQRR